MEHFGFVLAILPVHLMVMISPGPNFILLSTTALSVGRPTAVRAALGIAVGSLIWMTAAALGVSIILETLPVLGLLLKVAGGLYLIYLGIKLLSSNGMTAVTDPQNSEDVTINGFGRGLFGQPYKSKISSILWQYFCSFSVGSDCDLGSGSLDRMPVSDVDPLARVTCACFFLGLHSGALHPLFEGD
mgnify:CR=1 FL=1